MIHIAAVRVESLKVLLSLLLLCSVVIAKSLGPHPHNGLVPPYAPGNPKIVLSKSQKGHLEKGELVQDQTKGESAGRALAVQDIHSPPEYVWDRILDFPAYPKMVPKVADCYNYFTETLRNGTEIIKTRLKLNVFGVKFDSYIYHTHYPDLGSMTWTLDYTRRSTLDDSVGFWYVEKHPSQEKPNWSRVYYSCQLSVPSWVPGMVLGYLNKKAIREATTWVKRESEQLYKKDHAKGTCSLKRGQSAVQDGGGGLFGSLRDGNHARGKSWSFGAKPEPPPLPVLVVEEGEEEEAFPLRKTLTKAVLSVGSCYGAWRLANKVLTAEKEHKDDDQ